ncbi:uncharacterized protein G2W53_033668 [Senna tora]|uniref:Uncharacterized protein n=1 Tax=Senna tora TaxID=362788 RepID=A0A834W870_9FABA|nr:uncharacterized protein G2W53_033668 [Senna tora]
MAGAWIISQHVPDDKSRSDLRNVHELRGKRRVAQVSQTRRFTNRSGFDAPIGVVLSWEECRSCLNIFRTTNRGRIFETFTNYEAKDLFRKNLHKLRGKRLGAQVVQTLRFALYLRTGVVLMLRLESSWHESLLGMGGAWIMSQHIPDDKSRSDLRNLHELRGKRLVAQSETNTSVRDVFANRSGFDAPIGVVLAWEERGSCLNIFRITNRGRISETFTNYEANDLLRKSVDHVSTYFGRKITVGSKKPSRITRQNTCCARAWIMSQHIPDDKQQSDLRNFHELRGKRLVVQVSQTRRFANGYDAPIGVVLALEEGGSCLNIFWTTNPSRISETFTNYEAKDLLRK